VTASTNVTPRIARFVEANFDDAALVLDALRDWKISYEDELPGERLTAAVVLFADGSLEGVDEAFALAETDWRDLLVAAGVAHADYEDVLRRRLGE